MESQDAIFLTARDMADPAERAAYLSQACGNDADLRQRVETMLRDAAAADEFFGPKETALSGAAVTEGPGTVIGRFKLLEKIGEGGMGVVYMAEQRAPVIRKVALKIIKLGMDTRQVVARFEAERQALALMEHPNIAKVLDGGATESGRPYFVMELVAGLPITQFCDEANLSTHDRLELFLEVCSAIQHAHQKGIIHRDIKPSNILVTLHGDRPVPKVIDFGVAKATQGRLTDKTLFTQFQQFIGTPAYMSPEQASLSGLDIDTRSDIYALGVLLYELLTGRTPFDGKELLQAGLDEMRRTIREKQPPRPSNRLSTLRGEELTTTAKQRHTDPPKLLHLVRGDLDWIVMKALEKDRARRYETANGLAADIKRHINCEPVVARPQGNFYRFQRLVRRNKLAFTAVGMVLFSLVVGFGVSAWMFLRERDALIMQTRLRHEAETARANEARLRQKIEARAKIVQASALYDAGKHAEAEKLADEIEPEFIEPDPNHARLRRLIAWDYTLEHQWTDVRANLAKLIQIDGPMWDAEISQDHSCYTTVLAILGEKAAYESYRRRMISSFTNASNTDFDELLCRWTLLVPADAHFMQSLRPHADATFERTNYPPSRLDEAKAWNQWTRALVAYRRGDYQQAAQCTEECICQPLTNHAIILMALAVRAMAHHQLGLDQDAFEETAFVRQALEPIFQRGVPAFDRSQQYRWFEWLQARIFLNEATSMVGEPPASIVASVNQMRVRVDRAEQLVAPVKGYDTARKADYEEANSLLKTIPPYAIRMEGRKTGDAFGSLGWWYLNMHQWPQALDNWGAVVFGPDGKGSLQARDQPNNLFLLCYATAAAVVGSEAAYEKARAAAISRCGATSSTLETQRALTVCLLRAPKTNQMLVLEKMSAAVDLRNGAGPDCEQCAALALPLLAYRQADYHGSLQWSRSTTNVAVLAPSARARRHVLAALACAGLGQQADARAELAQCEDIILGKFNGNLAGDEGCSDSVWYNWWINYLLLREAIAAIEGPDAAPPSLPR